MNDDFNDKKMWRLRDQSENMGITQDDIDQLASELDKLGTITGGYVETTGTAIRPPNPPFTHNTYSQREMQLERRVIALERQVEDLTKVLKFFKAFLPQEES